MRIRDKRSETNDDAVVPQETSGVVGISGGGGGPYVPPGVRAIRFETTVPRPHKTFAYARFSSTAPTEASIERQLEIVGAYAKRNGMTIDGVFTDHATSGTLIERTGLNALRKELANHPGSVILVENVDRLSRSMDVYARLVIEFAATSTVVHDAAGPNGTLVEAIKAAIASEDRIRLLDRVAMGKIAAAKRGRWIAQWAPYGYRIAGPGEIEIDEETAPTVRLAYDLRAKGLNYNQVAAELNERGIAAPRCATWCGASVRKILNNQIYLGWCVWKLTRPEGHA